ncbi:hypothetical protein FB451DRAFT_1008795, partial [Mycena latifolia]
VWNVLGDEIEFRLREISTSSITPALLVYLASYSCVERLEFQSPDRFTGHEHLADIFTKVLPKHAESLVELCCAAHYECPWSFGPHNVNVISEIYKLTKLEMSVN